MSQLRNRNRSRSQNTKQRQYQSANASAAAVKDHDLPDQSKSESVWSMSFVVLIILCIVVYNEMQWLLPSITGSTATTKPYRDIDSFYPFYLQQHSDPINQRLHIIGSSIIALLAVFKPEVAISVMIGLLSGLIAFPLFRGISHGIFEGVIMIATASSMAHIHGVQKYMVMVAVIGYGCAWIGHFYFEQNQPATFIYPSYSLICDRKMFGAFYNQLFVVRNWDTLWDQGIDFKLALGPNLR